MNIKVIFAIYVFVVMIILVLATLIVAKANPETQITTSFVLNISNATNFVRLNETALNNSNTAENLTFTGNQNITRFIFIPKNSTIVGASNTVNLTGYRTTTNTSRNITFKDVDNVSLSQTNAFFIGRVIMDWIENSTRNGTSTVNNDQNTQFNQTINITLKSQTNILSINYSAYASAVAGGPVNENITLRINISIFNKTSSTYDVKENYINSSNATVNNLCTNRRNITIDLPSDYILAGDNITLSIIFNASDNATSISQNNANNCDGVSASDLFTLIRFNITQLGTYFPDTAYLIAGTDDGKTIFNQTTEFSTQNKTDNMQPNITDFLSSCNVDLFGRCNATLLINSNNSGIIQLNATNITYDYNASYLYTQTQDFTWSVANNITTGTSYNLTRVLNYTANNVSANFNMSGFNTNTTGLATSCGINNSIGTVSSNQCNINFNVTKGNKFGNFTFWETLMPVVEKNPPSCPSGYTNQGSHCIRQQLQLEPVNYSYEAFVNVTTNSSKGTSMKLTIPKSRLPSFANAQNINFQLNGTNTSLGNTSDSENYYILVPNTYTTSSLYNATWQIDLNYGVPSAQQISGGGGGPFFQPTLNITQPVIEIPVAQIFGNPIIQVEVLFIIGVIAVSLYSARKKKGRRREL